MSEAKVCSAPWLQHHSAFGSVSMSIRHLPSLKYLRQCFRYKNGKLFWLNRPREHFASVVGWKSFNIQCSGKEAGSVHKYRSSTRVTVGINGITYLRSRIVWALHHGQCPKLIDHRNRNTLDDRITNLRPASCSQNTANGKLRNDNTSGHKGVHWHKRVGKWFAKITINQKQMHLGYFDTAAAALDVREMAVKSHFGEFACSG